MEVSENVQSTVGLPGLPLKFQVRNYFHTLILQKAWEVEVEFSAGVLETRPACSSCSAAQTMRQAHLRWPTSAPKTCCCFVALKIANKQHAPSTVIHSIDFHCDVFTHSCWTANQILPGKVPWHCNVAVKANATSMTQEDTKAIQLFSRICAV